MKIQHPEPRKTSLSAWTTPLKEVATSRFFWTFAVLIAVFGIAIKILADHYNAGFSFTGVMYTQPYYGALIIFTMLFLSLRLLYISVILRPARPLTDFIHELKTVWFTPRRIVYGLSIMMLIPLFFSFFTSSKNLIPLINPFSWDPFFAQWEQKIHFGKQPWQWLQPFLGFALVTTIISFLYKFWFFSKYMVVFWQAFSLKDMNLRAQFFITMVLAWIINGFILATYFSSAGPCYFGHFYPDLQNPYAALMNFLRDSHEISPVYDLWAMDYLINSYNAKATNMFSGISAFPSMHVSVAFLNVLVGWRVNRTIGLLFTIYLFVIMIGSVHMGWHYAIDGYVSIFTTFMLWLIVGLFIPRKEDFKDV